MASNIDVNRCRSTGDILFHQIVFDTHDKQLFHFKPPTYNVSWKNPKCTKVTVIQSVCTPSVKALAVQAKFEDAKLKLTNALKRHEQITTIVNDCLSRPNPFVYMPNISNIEDMDMSLSDGEHKVENTNTACKPNETPNTTRQYPMADGESSSMPTSSDTSSRSERSLTLSSSETIIITDVAAADCER